MDAGELRPGGPGPGGGQAGIYPIVRLVAALLLMTVGGCAMYATIVALKPVAVEFGVSRGVASLPYMVFMLGFGAGSVVMGRVCDRFGLLPPALLASLALPAGLILAAQAGAIWQVCLAVGALAGFFGAASTFAPVISDISHWFVRRRGLAVAIVISGSYLAGAIWPPILQYLIDSRGWREAFLDAGLFALLVMLPLATFLYRRPTLGPEPVTPGRPRAEPRPLGLAPARLQGLICLAGIGCCAAMAAPQVHIVAYATDLGFAPARGAEMLAMMLGFGIVSRLVSGWISDRIGGLRTLLLGSSLQAVVLAAFVGADSLFALYALSVTFGLAQGGIVPSYAMIIRTFFPAGQAGWRIGAALLFTLIGMALGGWMAGALYDLTGSYAAAFVNAVAFNLMNIAIAAALLRRARRAAAPAAQAA